MRYLETSSNPGEGGLAKIRSGAGGNYQYSEVMEGKIAGRIPELGRRKLAIQSWVGENSRNPEYGEGQIAMGIRSSGGENHQKSLVGEGEKQLES
jgi:hypothetical protein